PPSFHTIARDNHFIENFFEEGLLHVAEKDIVLHQHHSHLCKTVIDVTDLEHVGVHSLKEVVNVHQQDQRIIDEGASKDTCARDGFPVEIDHGFHGVHNLRGNDAHRLCHQFRNQHIEFFRT